MILTDSGPLIAIADADDAGHTACIEALDIVSLPLFTILPVMTEAMHILGKRHGWTGRLAIWEMIAKRDLVIAQMSDDDLHRAGILMEKYNSTLMDFADASLVAIAERQKQTRIFTLDSDFKVYRLHGRRSFDVIP